MKWKTCSDQGDGRIRIVRRFAIFPICAGDHATWLQWVNIEQRYSDNWADDGWKNVRFV
jgi:hypothetical protein